jgi:hypothetical protein
MTKDEIIMELHDWEKRGEWFNDRDELRPILVCRSCKAHLSNWIETEGLIINYDSKFWDERQTIDNREV